MAMCCDTIGNDYYFLTVGMIYKGEEKKQIFVKETWEKKGT
jgi:hypothetical protein